MKPHYTVERHALDGLEAFLRVAARGSFRQAAADLAVTPSSVSQAIRALEARLGIALFTRTTRSVGLTEAGQRFLERTRPAFDAILAATEEAKGLSQRPSGLLRLAVPPSVVPVVLQPVLASFATAFPEVVVELVASEELVDLARDGFDAGIRMGEFIAADMIAVRLTPSFRFAIVASPDYLARRGRPRTLSELTTHACIRLRRSTGTVAPWRVEEDGRPIDLAVTGPLVVNDYATMLGAALGGVGLAQLPEPIASKQVAERRLEVLLRAHAPMTAGVFLYHPGRLQVLPKLRAFIDHVRSHLTGLAGRTPAPVRPRGRVRKTHGRGARNE
jgi:DNA-binding transcriptional LysR family regulator